MQGVEKFFTIAKRERFSARGGSAFGQTTITSWGSCLCWLYSNFIAPYSFLVKLNSGSITFTSS